MTRSFSILLRSPQTWAALVVVALLEIAAFRWFAPSLVVGAVALMLGGALLGAWAVVFVTSGELARRYFVASQAVGDEGDARAKALARDLEEAGSQQGARQLLQLREKFVTLSEILGQRLQAGELTYLRYHRTAEQVYGAALDNLGEIALALRSVRSIDPVEIDRRLNDLGDSAGKGAPHAREKETLGQRRKLWEEQHARAAELIAQNEAAMTALDRTATALATTQTGRRHTSVDAEAAMAELERLASGAGRYASAH